MRKHGLEISQPGLEPNKRAPWQMTKRRDGTEIHKYGRIILLQAIYKAKMLIKKKSHVSDSCAFLRCIGKQRRSPGFALTLVCHPVQGINFFNFYVIALY